MQIGDKVKVIYDSRPIGPRHEMVGTVKRITPAGSIEIEAIAEGITHEDGNQVIYKELFHPYHKGDGKHYAKGGWNTLWWE